jgi:dynein heavy chain
MFGDFMNETTREYQEIEDPLKLVKQIAVYMYETSINIELFRDAVNHLCRCCRALRLTRGNFLLIGVGGSGKKSTVTVASSMANCIFSEIVPTRSYGLKEFKREVFEKMLYPAGVEGKSVVFLFTDTNVIHESFLEEINSIINTGEIHLEKDQLERIKNDIEPFALQEKVMTDFHDFYVKRVRNNLHVVLAMSPVGEALRTRVRNFPSFVNNFTIDWLDPWPEKALHNVAYKLLEDDLLELNVQKDLITKIAGACVYAHQSVLEESDRFYKALKRRIYTTPKNYIDLVGIYKKLIVEKKTALDLNIKKLTNG